MRKLRLRELMTCLSKFTQVDMKLIWTSESGDLTPGVEFLILHKVRVLGSEPGTLWLLLSFLPMVYIGKMYHQAQCTCPWSAGLTEF